MPAKTIVNLNQWIHLFDVKECISSLRTFCEGMTLRRCALRNFLKPRARKVRSLLLDILSSCFVPMLICSNVIWPLDTF